MIGSFGYERNKIIYYSNQKGLELVFGMIKPDVFVDMRSPAWPLALHPECVVKSSLSDIC
jgi:hypothetical protein